jgi:hypothetical protein
LRTQSAELGYTRVRMVHLTFENFFVMDCRVKPGQARQ